MSEITEAMWALSRTMHRAAEERMERAGKVAATPINECDRTAALTLGSIAQALGWAAEDLERP